MGQDEVGEGQEEWIRQIYVFKSGYILVLVSKIDSKTYLDPYLYVGVISTQQSLIIQGKQNFI